MCARAGIFFNHFGLWAVFFLNLFSFRSLDTQALFLVSVLCIRTSFLFLFGFDLFPFFGKCVGVISVEAHAACTCWGWQTQH